MFYDLEDPVAFAPATGILIVSEAKATVMQPNGLLVLPWHFRDGVDRPGRNFWPAQADDLAAPRD